MPVASPRKPRRSRPAPTKAGSNAPRAEPLEPRQLLSTTYYVSPTGSDDNPGTSVAAPWATTAKVNAATYQPGDSILFQTGGTWRSDLVASSSGTAAAPITYGSYGDATLAKPTFIGSDVLDPASFTLASGTTYSAPQAMAVNWVFLDGALLHRAQDVLTQNGSSSPNDEATDIAYVEATPPAAATSTAAATTGTFYYDPTTTLLYVNDGAALTGHTVEAATRASLVSNNSQSYLAFSGLATNESADDNGGYGFDIEFGSNVTVTGCDASGSGKHGFGFIDLTGVVGSNLTGSQTAPDQGFGGASLIAYFVDQTANPKYTGFTASFSDVTYTDRGGAYPTVISHGGGIEPIASLSLTDINSPDGYNGGIYVDATGENDDERVTIDGGETDGGYITLISTTDAVVNGITLDGVNARLSMSGTGNVVQNSLFRDIDPNAEIGKPGAIVDTGTDDVVRFDTFDWSTANGAAIVVQGEAVSTIISGNVFANPEAIWLDFDDDDSAPLVVTSNDNVYSPGDFFRVGDSAQENFSFAQWQAGGFDAAGLNVDPDFVDPSANDFALTPDSAAIDLVTATPDASTVAVSTDILGNPRPYGGGYDAGAYELQQAKTVIVGTFSVAEADAAPPVTPGNTYGAAAVTFAVTLSAPLTTTATVDYATADGSATGDYIPTSGTLSFAPGQTTAYVRVGVVPNGTDAGDTFSLVLGHTSSGTEVATASADAAIPAVPPTAVPIGANVVYPITDGSAHRVLIHLAGAGSVSIDRQLTLGDIDEILVTGTTAASTLTITTDHGVHTPVGIIYVSGPLRSLNAPTVDLTGGLTINGTARSVTLGNVTGPADLNLLGTTGRPVVRLGTVSQASLTSAAPLASVTAASWSAADNDGTITAPTIGTVSVAGAFAAGLSVTGTADNSDGRANVSAVHAGTITGGTWAVDGRIGSVVAHSIAAGWSAVAGGTVGSIATAAGMAGSLTASSVGSVRVGGDLSSAALTLTGAAGKGYDLKSLRVVGTASGLTLRSTGSVNAVTVGAITGSTVFAGVSSTLSTLPTAAADFASTSRLNAFTITGGHGISTGMAASDVAASTVGHVRVLAVDTDNSGTPFGFAATALAAYADVEPGKKTYVWSAHSGGSPTTTGDYVVSVL